MEARPQDTPTCPVCKSVIDKEKLIPLYGRGSDQKDPRESLPPRPAGQREEAPEDNNNTGYFGDGMLNGINVSFGVGGFPFGFGLGPAFTIQTGRMGRQHHNVNIGHRGNRMHQGRRGSQEEEQRKTMARLLLTFAILFIIMIIFT
ncbi:PREDICTED: E3 ubiquitin-protein ligase RNF185-like [Amphimedon queenslandica]|uniref:RING-type E3 ubiquitin transferase n=1 Tax=Amphimedon queenslandica TaxID=400682 RepID=A0AAN0IG76_AMPQE|nr:PREDICTED: E3 ubiquitin-protein ligase RNF185-like [Amphimedon queenslandica]|eukprot:XP_003387784.3 PREDICTED: E3 ubiquitin-protein ligase RNF185-like [Amphimedon queenslandica]